MKNSNDTIGNRTRDLSACSAVPQPNAPPRAPQKKINNKINLIYLNNKYCCGGRLTIIQLSEHTMARTNTKKKNVSTVLCQPPRS